MSATRLYLVRHGQTDWNLAGKLQGQTDIPLNETGRQQAKQAKKLLGNLSFDAVYSSPLSRAVVTAQLTSGHPTLQIITDVRIKEIAFGQWEGCKPKEIGEAFSPFFFEPDAYRPTQGGESLPQLIARVSEFTAHIKSKHMGQTVLVTSHGTALHALLVHELNLPMQDFWKIPLHNCSVACLELEGEQFVLQNILAVDETDYLAKHLT